MIKDFVENIKFSTLIKSKLLIYLLLVVITLIFACYKYYKYHLIERNNFYLSEEFIKNFNSIENYLKQYKDLSQDLSQTEYEPLDKNQLKIEGLVAIIHNQQITTYDHAFDYLKEEPYKSQILSYQNYNPNYYNEIVLLSNEQFSSSDLLMLFFQVKNSNDKLIYLINKTFMNQLLLNLQRYKNESNAILTSDGKVFLASQTFPLHKISKDKTKIFTNQNYFSIQLLQIAFKNYSLFLKKSLNSSYLYSYCIPQKSEIMNLSIWYISFILLGSIIIALVIYQKNYPKISTAKAIQEENKRSVLSLETMNQLLSTGKKEIALLSITISDMHSLINFYDANELEELFKSYTDRLYKAIHASRGLIESHSSESLRALWIASGTLSRPAKAAIESAVFIRESLLVLNDKLKNTNKAPLSFKIIINSGDAIVGQLENSTLPMVISPIVSEINNLQIFTQDFPYDILITSHVQKAVGHFFITKPIDAKYYLPANRQLFSVERRLKDISSLKSINEPWGKHFSSLKRDGTDEI